MSTTRNFLRFLITGSEQIGEDGLDKKAIAWLQNQVEKHIQGN